MKDTEKQEILRKRLTKEVDVLIQNFPKKEKITYKKSLKGLPLEQLILYKNAISKLKETKLS